MSKINVILRKFRKACSSCRFCKVRSIFWRSDALSQGCNVFLKVKHWSRKNTKRWLDRFFIANRISAPSIRPNNKPAFRTWYFLYIICAFSLKSKICVMSISTSMKESRALCPPPPFFWGGSGFRRGANHLADGNGGLPPPRFWARICKRGGGAKTTILQHMGQNFVLFHCSNRWKIENFCSRILRSQKYRALPGTATFKDRCVCTYTRGVGVSSSKKECRFIWHDEVT